MNVTANRLGVLALLVFSVCGCSDSIIRVEITEPTFREKYIEILKKNSLEYTVGEDGVISVKAGSSKELDGKMKEYIDWEMQERKKGKS